MAYKVPTCLIEKNPLFREGLKSLLRQSSFDPIIELRTVEDLARLNDISECKLAIVSTEQSPEGIEASVRALKSKSQDVRVVVLSEFIYREHITASFSAGADGFLLKDISPAAFIASLNLIMTGEKVFPTSMASIIASGWDNWLAHENPATAVANTEFSAREIEIIQCLAEAQPNKTIARNLDISEATVKVHLKTILRKLGFSNRTQVAIWALNNGFASGGQEDFQTTTLA